VTKIVLLNGPPRCGKDAAAMFLKRHFNVHEIKMSLPFKRSLPELFCLTHEQIKHLEDTKDEPNALFYGLTWREVQISLSENWLKPIFGVDVMGKLLIRRMKQLVGNFDMLVSSDAGFRDEWLPIIRWQGGKNFLLIRIHRDGCSFSNDSRSFIELADMGVTEIDLENKYDLEMYEQQVLRHVERWMGKR
jgi:hypothetical protein